jgi:cytochrome c-type biogenesis protein CcmH/NrfG
VNNNTTDKIIEAAALMYKAEQTDSRKDLRLFSQAMKRLKPDDRPLMMMMCKLMEGKRFSIASDDPEMIRRSTEVAKAYGATVIETSEPVGLISILNGIRPVTDDTISILIEPPHGRTQ